jgi:hypothetical protein
MATTDTKSIPAEQFLTMAINLLHKAFIEQNRTEAKNLFKTVSEGKIVPLTNVQMEDKSVVRFDVSLDHSEYRGKLNFGAFRASLSITLANLVKAMQEGQKINTYTAEHNENSMIFGITGVTMENDTPAVMVISTQVSDRGAAVMLRPMYLNYEQFLQSQQSEA